MVSVKQELEDPEPEPLGFYFPPPDPLAFGGCQVLPENSKSWEKHLDTTERRRRRHANETEEQRRTRLAKDAQRRREARMLETEEEARNRRAKEAAARRHSRQYRRQYLETEEEAKQRRQKTAEKKRIQRQSMAPEQVAEMRRREAARQAEKRKRQQEEKVKIKTEDVEVEVEGGRDDQEAEEELNRRRLVSDQSSLRQYQSPPIAVPQSYHQHHSIVEVEQDVKPIQLQMYPHHKVYPPNFYH